MRLVSLRTFDVTLHNVMRFTQKSDAQQNRSHKEESNTHTNPVNDGHKRKLKNIKTNVYAHLFGQ